MINIEWNNPIILSISSILISFAILIILFIGIKPSFVTTVDNNGNKIIQRSKIALYSSLFSFFIGIITFFLVADKEETKDETKEEEKEDFPDINTNNSVNLSY